MEHIAASLSNLGWNCKGEAIDFSPLFVNLADRSFAHHSCKALKLCHNLNNSGFESNIVMKK